MRAGDASRQVHLLGHQQVQAEGPAFFCMTAFSLNFHQISAFCQSEALCFQLHFCVNIMYIKVLLPLCETRPQEPHAALWVVRVEVVGCGKKDSSFFLKKVGKAIINAATFSFSSASLLLENGRYEFILLVRQGGAVGGVQQVHACNRFPAKKTKFLNDKSLYLKGKTPSLSPCPSVQAGPPLSKVTFRERHPSWQPF